MTRPNIVWMSTHDISPHLGADAGDPAQELTMQ
jgi:hypothetical protein